MEELTTIIEELEKRIELLERLISLKNIKIPTGGKLVVNTETADPTGENGMIYYNSTSNKFKVFEGGSWKTITTT